MTTDTRPHARVDPQTVRTWLDRLDQRMRPPTALSLRRSERFEYRADVLTLELLQADDTSQAHTVAARNISPEGIGLLASRFVYPGTRCRIMLTSPYGSGAAIAGRVARCRYLVGSGMLYEIGVAFDRPIDVALFAPHARLIRVLLVDENETTHDLLAGFLHGLHVLLTTVGTRDEALAAVAAGGLDLIVLDLENRGFDALALTRRLRNEGYVGPIVGMALDSGTDLHSRCVQAGCTGYVVKPITRDDVRGLVTALADEPLLSTLAHDTALAPLIDRFVGTLHARVTRLSHACEAGERGALHEIARDLRAEAGSYGFATISDEAAYLEELLGDQASDAHIRRALRRLMDLCLRARPTPSQGAAMLAADGAVSARPAAGKAS